MYERLKREKGDRSFSELIAAKLDEGGTLHDVMGNRILDPDVMAEVEEVIERESMGTVDRLSSERSGE